MGKKVAQAEKSILFLNDAADYRNLLYRGVVDKANYAVNHQYTQMSLIIPNAIFTVVVWVENPSAALRVAVTDQGNEYNEIELVRMSDGRFAGKWVIQPNADAGTGLRFTFSDSDELDKWRGSMMISGSAAPQFYADAPEQVERDAENAYLSSIAAFFGGSVDVAGAVAAMETSGAPFYFDTVNKIAVASNFFAQKLAASEALIESLIVRYMSAVKYVNDDPAQGIESQAIVDGGKITAQNAHLKYGRFENVLSLNVPEVMTAANSLIYIQDRSVFKLSNGVNEEANYTFALRLTSASTSHYEGVELSFIFPSIYPATRTLVPSTLRGLLTTYFVSPLNLASDGRYIKYRYIKMKTTSSSSGEQGNGAYVKMVAIENNQWLITTGAEQLEFYN